MEGRKHEPRQRGGRLGTLLHMKAKPFAKRGDWGVCASIRVSEVPEAGRALSRQRPQLLLDRPTHYYLLWGAYTTYSRATGALRVVGLESEGSRVIMHVPLSLTERPGPDKRGQNPLYSAKRYIEPFWRRMRMYS